MSITFQKSTEKELDTFIQMRINQLREEGAEKGFERIELDMWEFNEGTLTFYESAGFQTYRRYMELDLK